MCYPKPGPRCSAHVKKELAAAVKKVNAANADPSLSFEEKEVVFREMKKVEKVYDSTPEGQEELSERLAEGGFVYSRGELRRRLLMGQVARANAKRAYEESIGQGKPTPEHHVPNPLHSLNKQERSPLAFGQGFYEHVWGENEAGEPVFFAKVRRSEEDGAPLVICDIEKNPDAHGMSGHQFTKMLCADYGVDQASFTGSFTEKGFEWFSRTAKEGAPVTLMDDGELSTEFSEMTFVHDWNDRRPKYGL